MYLNYSFILGSYQGSGFAIFFLPTLIVALILEIIIAAKIHSKKPRALRITGHIFTAVCSVSFFEFIFLVFEERFMPAKLLLLIMVLVILWMGLAALTISNEIRYRNRY